MHIAWGQLGLVLVIGLIVGTGVVSVFAVGVLGLSRMDDARESGRPPVRARAQALLCFGACIAAVLYGISLLTNHA